jgi:hypothetical protein
MPIRPTQFSAALGLTEEHRAAGDLAFRIASKFAGASLADRDAQDAYWKELVAVGFAGMSLPEEYGGGGQGLLDMCVVTERSAAAGYPAGRLVLSQGIVGAILARHGTDDQRRIWLPKIASGEVQFCFALTESDSGSNAAKMRTTAREVGGRWSISGEKTYISAVDQADAMLVAAQTPDTGGITLFLVEDPRARLTYEPIDMGFAMFENQFVVHLDDVEVGADAVVGKPGKGLRALFDGLNPERLLGASHAVGVGRWGLELGTAYAGQRVVFEGPIGGHQAVAHPLAESWVHLEAAWALTVAAARCYDKGAQIGAEANAAKLLACDAGYRAVDQALQTHGGSGYVAELRIIEKLMFARFLKTAPVTREMALNHIAMEALGLPKSY